MPSEKDAEGTSVIMQAQSKGARQMSQHLKHPSAADIRRSTAVVAVLLLLAACGGAADTEETAGEGPDTEALATNDGAPEDLSEEVQQAADEAQQEGMLFITSHDEIVERAQEEGQLDVHLSIDDFTGAGEGFQEQYPDIATYVEEFTGTDTYQRFLLEAEAEAASDWDVAYAPPEHYDDWQELLAPYDILGMAEAGILDIPVEMIDPERRNVVAIASQAAGIAYNPTLIDEADLPQTWEDLCDPAFQAENQQFILDIRPTNIAPLVAVWGQERVNELAACMAGQDPLWDRGQTEALTRVAAGENALHVFTNYHSATRVAEKAGGNLEVAFLEPVPVRLGESLSVFNEAIANSPHAALLFIEFMTGPMGQEILDADPLKSSIFAETSDLREELGDRETAVADFEHYDQMEVYMTEIVEAMGFPQAANQ